MCTRSLTCANHVDRKFKIWLSRICTTFFINIGLHVEISLLICYMLCGTITSLILQMPALKTRRSATADRTRDTLAYVSQIVSISQVIGCEDRLQNDLHVYCVEWGVKLYSNQPTMSVEIK